MSEAGDGKPRTDWADYEIARVKRENPQWDEDVTAHRCGYLRALADLRVLMRLDAAASRYVIDLDRMQDAASAGNPAAAEILRADASLKG